MLSCACIQICNGIDAHDRIASCVISGKATSHDTPSTHSCEARVSLSQAHSPIAHCITSTATQLPPNSDAWQTWFVHMPQANRGDAEKGGWGGRYTRGTQRNCMLSFGVLCAGWKTHTTSLAIEHQQSLTSVSLRRTIAQDNCARQAQVYVYRRSYIGHRI